MRQTERKQTPKNRNSVTNIQHKQSLDRVSVPYSVSELKKWLLALINEANQDYVQLLTKPFS